ncbi:DUF1249 domain-containing protein [Acidihalobacter ferrooxydans]|uniref:DUF1249 domain-containing protein n=1 Tax=Acidihalobacter ferrooxydans TaxID=1765967 RepID=A0A1P8UFZ8_9GAMM|nr:DUF1249 domain-containing protein [Acidihalobacter ferrooxydans]APZ42681.1 hypothetical protein BW247_05860 [Acidihalobacter ferrooxydans]
MFADLKMPAHLTMKPISFAALMELYERNYIALRRLCPVFDDLTVANVSRVTGAPPLQLRVLERNRYTTTLELTQRIGQTGRIPVLPLRVYHDARQAEVLVAGVHPGGLNCDPGGGVRQRQLGVCWEANLFLHDWLSHCVVQGHRFGKSPVSAR